MSRPKTSSRPPAAPAHGVRLVHADAAVCVVDKPAGLLSATGPGQHAPSAFGAVKDYARETAGPPRGPKRGPERQSRSAWIVHRLDREVSGLMVFALDQPAFEALKAELKARRMQRRYLALVEGEVKEAEGSVASFIADGGPGKPVEMSEAPPARPLRATEEDDEPARRAITHWKRLHAGHGYSLLEVRLETGRKHQIRAHLAGIGHPIAGDRLYGARTDPLKRVGLHAYALSLAHPTTGAPLHFRSEPPTAFFKAVGTAPTMLAEETRERTPTVREGTFAHTQAQASSPHGETPELHRPGLGDANQGGRAARPPVSDTGWDNVAGWYDDLLSRRGSDHHEQLVLPGVVRMLDPRPGQRILDLACGQGDLCLRLARLGCAAVGVDAAPRLVEAARRHAREELPRSAPPPAFLVGDALRLGDQPELAPASFDGAACVLALMNMDPLAPVVRGVARLLKPGAAWVVVILHPAFRAPRQSGWGTEGSGAAVRMHRRVEGYLSPVGREIVMNPGEVAHGKAPVKTTTWHRPLETYVRAFAEAGLPIDGLEEWASRRTSEPGPRAREENRIRGEIPMFLALRGRKAAAPRP